MFVIKENLDIEQALNLIDSISDTEIKTTIGLTKAKLNSFINSYCNLDKSLTDGIIEGVNCNISSIDFTPREKEFLEQIEQNNDINIIAKNLYVSQAVVKTNVKIALLKLIAKFYPDLAQIKN